MTKYYNIFMGLWLELDHYQQTKMELTADASKLQEMVEQDRIIDFLAGLNPDLDQMSSSLR